MKDRIEIWLQNGGCLGAIESSHAPDRGDAICLRGKTFRVVGRSYTIDYIDDPWTTVVNCILTLEEVRDDVKRVGK